MKKLKLYSGIGLLSTFFLSIIYFSVADQYGLWTKETLYISLGVLVTSLVGVLFLIFCVWLISEGSDGSNS